MVEDIVKANLNSVAENIAEEEEDLIQVVEDMVEEDGIQVAEEEDLIQVAEDIVEEEVTVEEELLAVEVDFEIIEANLNFWLWIQAAFCK